MLAVQNARCDNGTPETFGQHLAMQFSLAIIFVAGFQLNSLSSCPPCPDIR